MSNPNNTPEKAEQQPESKNGLLISKHGSGELVRLEFKPAYIKAIHEHTQTSMQEGHEILVTIKKVIERSPKTAKHGFFQDLGEALKDIRPGDILHANALESVERASQFPLRNWLRKCRKKLQDMAQQIYIRTAEILRYKMPKICQEAKTDALFLELDAYQHNSYKFPVDDGSPKLVIMVSKPALARILEANAKAAKRITKIREKLLHFKTDNQCPPEVLERIYPKLSSIITALEQVNLIIHKAFYDFYRHPFHYKEAVEVIQVPAKEEQKVEKTEESERSTYHKSTLGTMVTHAKSAYKLVGTAGTQLYQLYKGLQEGGKMLIRYDPKLEKRVRKVIVRQNNGEEPPRKQNPGWGPGVSYHRSKQINKKRTTPIVTSLRGALAPWQSRLLKFLDCFVTSVPRNDGTCGKWPTTKLNRILANLLYPGYMYPIRA